MFGGLTLTVRKLRGFMHSMRDFMRVREGRRDVNMVELLREEQEAVVVAVLVEDHYQMMLVVEHMDQVVEDQIVVEEDHLVEFPGL